MAGITKAEQQRRRDVVRSIFDEHPPPLTLRFVFYALTDPRRAWDRGNRSSPSIPP